MTSRPASERFYLVALKVVDEGNAALCVFKSRLCVSGNKSQREELDSILFIFEVSHLDFMALSHLPPRQPARADSGL